MDRMMQVRWERYPRTAESNLARRWLTVQANLGLAANTVEAYARALEDYLRFSHGKDTDITNAGRDHLAAGETTDHPTQKPVELFAIPIRQHTAKGDICYEPFSGSGTQLVAAESLGRVCYAMEKSPPFVAVALERLSEMGPTPKLCGGRVSR